MYVFSYIWGKLVWEIVMDMLGNIISKRGGGGGLVTLKTVDR